MTDKDSSALLIIDGNDQFPVGMRVLAVDDDPICLQLLESMLLKCKYQVTTTTEAITALEMLRENKDKFDLIISDVEMPHMDGFKFLELVGLEMDLPVIMLSSHSQTELVMKGITHGACDYLLKPARMEELKNIWQHVVRRKKFGSKERMKPANVDKACNGSLDGERGASSVSINADQNGKISRKRKDQRKGKEEDGEGNGHENVEPSTQKKPRVVWSQELHEKFVSAVRQLGFEKAVPKKILELMNVEGITRENVASHLQKYRLYLKRLDNVGGQAATAQRSNDPFYIRKSTVDAYAEYHALAGSERLSCTALYPPSAMLGRLNTAASMGSRAISYSGAIPPNHIQHLTASVDIVASQNDSLFQRVPTFFDLNQLQHNKIAANLRGFDSTDARIIGVPTNISDATFGPAQRWEGNVHNYNQNPSQTFGTTNSLVAAASGSFGTITPVVEQTTANFSQNDEISMPIQLNSGTPNVLQDSELETSSMESKIKSSEKYPPEQTKAHNSILDADYESLDELMNAIAKLEHNETMLTEADFGFDSYPLGSCI